MPHDHKLDPYDPDSWRQALEGLPAARCSLAPAWPRERLLQGDPLDLLLLRADSLARAARATGARLWIEVGADPAALALLRAHGLELRQAPDAPLLAPWSGGNVPGVRSVQRLGVPPDHDAKALMERYLAYLHGLPGVQVQRDEDGVRFLGGGLELLRFEPVQLEDGRAWMILRGGRLAHQHPSEPGVLELRVLPGGEHALIAVHHFRPSLPWPLYRATQAPVHLLAVAGFNRSLAE
jgi:hypothetical protein